MKNAHQLRSVFMRELSAYFNSPIAYIFIVVFVTLSCGMFMSNFFLVGQADMRFFFDMLPLALCVFIPALTMRLWAEDRKGNTFELLLTFPMPSWKVVIGKFGAAFVFYFLALAATLPVAAMLFCVGTPDPGTVWGGYSGAVFLGGFYLALGLFISGLFADQIVAFIMAMVVMFFFWAAGWEVVAGTIDGWIPGAGSFLANTLGVTRHFTGFEKGIVDLRDILHFVLSAGIFLVLNAQGIEDRLKRQAKVFFAATAILGCVIILAADVLLADMPLGRLDITKGRLYTVTEAAGNILARLDAPVTLKLYITPQDKMPTAMKSIEQDIKDRLEELKVVSRGKLVLKTIRMDAEVFDKEAKENGSQASQLARHGIAPISVRSIDKDEVGVKLVYASIAVGYKDRDEEFIPRILPNTVQNLEYEVASKIYRMMLDKKPSVALVAPYKEKNVDASILEMFKRMGQPAPLNMRDDAFRALESGLQYENYKVSRIHLTEKEPIPDGTDALVIVAPEKLLPRQRWEISKFLYEGGHVIVAAQSYTFDYNQNPRGTAITPKRVSSDMNDVIAPYGVKVDDAILMDSRHELINVQSNLDAGPVAFTAPVKVPIQIVVDQESMNQKVAITSGIPPIFYLWGSALTIDHAKVGDAKLKETVLINSSPKSWKVLTSGSMLTAQQVTEQGKLFQQFPLAVMLEGKFPDVFAGKTAPDWDEGAASAKANEAGVVKPVEKKISAAVMPDPKKAKPGALLVVGCSKMFEEELIRDNGSMMFFTNAVDVLTLGGALVNIRNHQPIIRRVRPLSGADKALWRFVTVGLVPCAFVLWGLLRFMWRRQEKERYLKMLSAQKSVGENV
ncbi:MAG: Gldg family protein [Candidatus Omnitrophica bacterium]|nr:Gldg family protein [Candidatus Omnitrophota bacterium]